MKTAFRILLLLLLSALLPPADVGLASPPQAGVTVNGTLVGRSGKPLGKAWVCLGQLSKDAEGKDAGLALTQLTATADDNGRFQIKGVAPGAYTLVYRPAPATGAKGGGKISIRQLSQVIRSFLPAFRDREVGTSSPFEDRPWPSAAEFTLLKGHTLYCAGVSPHMKIWNATVRSGRQGPYLEMRKNVIWRQDFQKDAQIKFEAWSF